MSVLVEALSIVVPRRALDLRYPGGSAAYLAEAMAAIAPDSDSELRPRWAVADEHLTSVSFLSGDDSLAWARRLADFGLTRNGSDRSIDIVCFDHARGPGRSAHWLAWSRRDNGVVTCWLAGTEPGDLARPEGWTPDESRTLARVARTKNASSLMKLAEEHGVEHWLDLTTGRQVTRPSTAREKTVDLMPPVLAALEELEWEWETLDDSVLRVDVCGKEVRFALVVSVDDDLHTVICYGILPSLVTPDVQPAIAETITRINFGLRLGAFDMDYEEGELRYRAGVDVEGGTLTEHMVLTLMGNVCASIDHYYPVLARVQFGGVAPEQALKDG